MINHIASGLLLKLNDDSIDTLGTLEEIVSKAIKIEKSGFSYIVFTFKDKSVIRAPDVWSICNIPM